jgi:hypothetical protein
MGGRFHLGPVSGISKPPGAWRGLGGASHNFSRISTSHEPRFLVFRGVRKKRNDSKDSWAAASSEIALGGGFLGSCLPKPALSGPPEPPISTIANTGYRGVGHLAKTARKPQRGGVNFDPPMVFCACSMQNSPAASGIPPERVWGPWLAVVTPPPYTKT